MTTSNPMQDPFAWGQSAKTYDEGARAFTGRYAQDAVELGAVTPGSRVLDVAAGTGAVSLAAARAGADVLATDFAPGMLDVLAGAAEREGLGGIRTAVMDGQALTEADRTFDRAFSMFGLMFFPDLSAGFRELHRVLAPEGRAVVGVWARGGTEIVDVVVEALGDGVPEFPMPDEPAPWDRIADAEGLAGAMTEAGFANARVFEVRHLWHLPSPEWLWSQLPSMSPGFRPIFDHLDGAQTNAFGEALRAVLDARYGSGPFALGGDALLGVGHRR